MIELRLLNRPHVILDGEAVTEFVSDKVLALLCYLALSPGPFSRETLADLLWGEMTETRARANLRVALHNLRKQLPNCLEVTRKRVSLKRDPGLWLDVAEFEAAARQREQVGALERAAALYQGDLLASVSVSGGPAFEGWLAEERERLRLIFLEVLEGLANHYTAAGAWHQATAVARRLVSLEPWREASQRQLMVLLARQQKYSQALAQYEACCQALQEGLAIEPLAETRALAARIRALRRRPRHNLPPAPGPFVGRTQALAEVRALLRRPEVRLLSIVGLAGMGKTRLARQAARAEIGAFLDGVYLVSLPELQPAAALVRAVAQALRLELAPGHDPQAQILAFVQDKELLLLLDGYERLLPDLALLPALLARGPGVKLMICSRASLQLPGETVLALEGLASTEATALFLAYARQRRPGFRPTAAEREAITRICTLVEGMPLALELAAGWVDALPLPQLAAAIEADLGWLRRPGSAAAGEEQSVRAALARSWQGLAPEEQAVLGRLARLEEAFTVQSALLASGSDPALMARLVRHSLLQYRQAQGYYRLPGLLRRFVLGQGEREGVSDALGRTL